MTFQRLLSIVTVGSLLAGRLFADIVPLGVVFKNESISPKLSFINAGNTEVVLGRPTISCDCLQSWFANQTVSKGASVALPFTYVSHRTGRIDVKVEFRDSANAVAQTTVVRGFVADRSWIITPPQLAVDAQVVVIDVRDPPRYAQAHLPRATNVLPFALKARTDLRDRKVVLVDDGFAPVDLLEHVAALHDLGFKDVTMLDGGVPAWIRAGQAVVGATRSALSSATISASDFVRASTVSEWRVVEVAPVGPTYPDATTANTWNDAADAVLAPSPANPAAKTLIVAPDVTTYARIESRLGREGHAPVYYLAGGRAALDQFRATEKAVAMGSQLIQVQPPIHSHSAASSCNCGGK